MNKIFKVIWSKARACYVVVSEVAKTTGKGKSVSKRRRVSHAAIALSLFSTAFMAGIAVDDVQASEYYAPILIRNGSIMTDAVRNTSDANQKNAPWKEEYLYRERSQDGRVVGKDYLNFIALNPSVSPGESKEGIRSNITDIGMQAVVIGFHSSAEADYAVSLGSNAQVTGAQGIAIGDSSTARSQNAVGIGTYADAAGEDSIAIGNNAYTRTGGGLAGTNYGGYAMRYATAIGSNATVEQAFGVALGAASVVGQNDTLNAGSTFGASNYDGVRNGTRITNKTDVGEASRVRTLIPTSYVSIGAPQRTITHVLSDNVAHDVAAAEKARSDKMAGLRTDPTNTAGSVYKEVIPELTRRISHLAAGFNDTDAVNMAQLRSLANNKLSFATDGGTTTGITLGSEQDHNVDRLTFGIKGEAGSGISTSVKGNDVIIGIDKSGLVKEGETRLVSGGTVYDYIKGLDLKGSSSDAGEEARAFTTDSGDVNAKLKDTVTVAGGKNIATSGKDKTITVSLKDSLEGLESVEAKTVTADTGNIETLSSTTVMADTGNIGSVISNTVTADSGTIQKLSTNTVTAKDVNAGTVSTSTLKVPGESGKNVVISKNGVDFGGNTLSNLADGTAASDAATYGQLTKVKQEAADAAETAADKKVKKATRAFTADDKGSINATLATAVGVKGADSNIKTSISGNDIKVKLASDLSGLNSVETSSITADNGNIGTLTSDTVTAENGTITNLTTTTVTADNVKTGDIKATTGTIETLNTNTVTAQEVKTGDIKADTGKITTLNTETGTINNLTSDSGTIRTLNTETGNINTVNSEKVRSNTVEVPAGEKKITITKDGINAGGTSITNLSDGADDHDAATVGQVTTKIEEAKQDVVDKAGKAADEKINNLKGENTRKFSTDNGNVNATLEDTVAVAGGDNITTSGEGKKITVSLKDSLTGLRSVDAENINGGAVTANTLTVPGKDGKTVVINKDGANFGGNKLSNVADGTANNDAATYGQLTKATEKVKQEAADAAETAADNKVKAATRAFTADDEGSISATLATAVGVKGADDNIKTSVSGNDIKVKLSSDLTGLNSVATNSITAGKGNFTTLRAENGTIKNLSSDNGNITTLNTETGNITTLNTETGNIDTVNSEKVTAKTIEVPAGDNKITITKDGINAGGTAITNLTDGTGDHDAATVGQVKTKIDEAKKEVEDKAGKAADEKIKNLKDEKTRKFSTDNGNVDATLGDTVTVAGSENITTSGEGKTITVSLKDSLSGLRSVDAENINGGAVTTKLLTVNNGQGEPATTINGDGINTNSVTAKTVNSESVTANTLTVPGKDGKTVVINKDGANFGGNKLSNVADGTANNDAATYGQLTKATEKVKQEAADAAETAADNKVKAATRAFTADDEGSISATLATAVGVKGADNNVKTSVSGNDIKVKLSSDLSGLNSVATNSITADNGTIETLNTTTVTAENVKTGDIKATTGTIETLNTNTVTAQEVKTGDIKATTGTIETLNTTTVTAETVKTNDIKAETGTIKTINSETGNIQTVNSDKVTSKTIEVPTGDGNKVSITKDGIDAGGKGITNLADGTGDHDAATVGQVTTKIEEAKKDVVDKAGKAADEKIKNLKDENTRKFSTDNGNVDATLGDTVTVAGGENITTSGAGKTITVSLKDSLSGLRSVEAENINGGTVTTKLLTVNNAEGQPATTINGDGINTNSVTANTLTIPGEGGKNVVINNEGANFGGNKISNVADGTEANDAATYGQLTKAAEKIEEKAKRDAADVANTAADNKIKAATRAFTADDEGSINASLATAVGVKGADSNITTSIDGNDIKVKLSSDLTGLNSVNTNKITAGKGDFTTLKAENGTIKNLSSDNGNITTLNTETGNITTLNTETGNITTLNTETGNIKTVNSDKVTSKVIEVPTGEDSKVSITKDGINAGGKAISNVADGVNDQDAATVGQVTKKIDEAKKDVEEKAGKTADEKINNLKGENTRKFSTDSGNVDATLGDTVTVAGGENISTSGEGKTITVSLKDSLSGLRSVEAETINGGAVTTKLLTVNNGAGQPATTINGDGINTNSVTANTLTIPGESGKNVVINKDGANFGGNKLSNVADGTDASDAATYGQLTKTAEKLKKDAADAAETAADNKVKSATRAFTADDNGSITASLATAVGVKGVDSNIITSVSGNDIKVKLSSDLSGLNSVETGTITADNGTINTLSTTTVTAENVKTGDIKATTGTIETLNTNTVTAQEVKTGDIKATTGTIETLNTTTVTAETVKTNDIKAETGTIKTLNSDTGNITTLNTETGNIQTVNSDKVTSKVIEVPTGDGNKVSITKDGIDAGGKGITNLADGTGDHDAATVGQVTTKIDEAKKDVEEKAGKAADEKIKNLKNENTRKFSTDNGNVDATLGDTVAVAGGENITTSGEGKTITVSLKDSLTGLRSVEAETINGGAVTTKLLTVNNNEGQPATTINGDGINTNSVTAKTVNSESVTAKTLTIPGESGKDVVINKDGANFGGNKLSNVADGTDASDAATYGQLTKTAEKLKQDAADAAETAADNKVKSATRAFTADDNGAINATLATAVGVKGADSNIVTSIEDNDIKVKLSSDLSGLNSVETNSITADQGNITTLTTDTVTAQNVKTGDIKATTGTIETLKSNTVTAETITTGDINAKTGTIETLNTETGNIKNVNSDKVTSKVIEVPTGDNSKVSITKDGINAGDKAISNVADGVNDHDAATVGQVTKKIDEAKKDVEEKAGKTADEKINNLKGENTRKFSTDNGNVDATLEDTVSVAGGDNITTSGEGKTIKVSLNDSLTGLRNVEAETINGGEVTTKLLTVNNGEGQPATTIDGNGINTNAVTSNTITVPGASGKTATTINGDGINTDTVTAKTVNSDSVTAKTLTIPGENGKNVVINKDGANFGGNKLSNVADGTEANDAATYGQLTKTAEKLKKDAADAAETAADNKVKSATRAFTADDNGAINATLATAVGVKGADSNIVTSIADNDIKVKLSSDLSGLNSVETNSITADQGNITTLTTDTVTAQNVKTGDIKATTGTIETLKSNTVTAETITTGDINAKTGTIETLNTETGNIKTVNSDKVTSKVIEVPTGDDSKVSITKDGINAGSKAISNVADGVNDQDAATVGQVTKKIDEAKKDVEDKAGKAADEKINNLKGENTRKFSTDNGNVDATLEDTVSVAGGDNITTSGEGKTIKVSLKDSLTGLRSVEAETINGGAVTTKLLTVNNGEGQPATTIDGNGINTNAVTSNTITVPGTSGKSATTINGEGINTDTVTAKTVNSDSVTAKTLTIPGENGKNVVINKDGANFGGNKLSNVADGTESSDAATYGQLTKAVDEAKKAAGEDAADQIKKATRAFTADDENSINATLATAVGVKGADSNITTSIEGNDIKVKLSPDLTGLNSVETNSITADQGNITTLTTDTVTAKNVKTNDIKAETGTIKTINSDTGNITTLNTENGNIKNLNSDKVTSKVIEVPTGDDSKVSITKDGINAGGKAISNVADGVNDQDAATVGQVTKKIDDAKKDVEEKAGKAADEKINNLKGENTRKFSTDSGDVDATLEDTVSVAGGKNITTSGEGKKITVSLNDSLTGLTSVEAETINGGAVTTKLLTVNNGEGQPATTIDGNGINTNAVTSNIITVPGANGKSATTINGEGINTDTVTAKTVNSDAVTAKTLTIPGENGKNVVINKDGADFGGNKLSNVADGTENSDAATYGQLTKAVDEAKKAAGENAADQIKKATRAFTADDENSINATLATAVGVKGADSNITTSIEGNDIKVKLSSDLRGLNSVETNSITADQGNITTLTTDTITAQNVKTGDIKATTGTIETLNTETGNIKTVNSDKVMSKVIEVPTGDDSKVSITKDGINAGGKTISNVADGVNDQDAATVGQVTKKIDDAKKDVEEKAGKAADDKIKKLKGENTRKFSTDNGDVDATLDDTVSVAGGKNIATSGDGKTITVSLKDSLTGLTSVEADRITGGAMTTQLFTVNNGAGQATTTIDGNGIRTNAVTSNVITVPGAAGKTATTIDENGLTTEAVRAKTVDADAVTAKTVNSDDITAKTLTIPGESGKNVVINKDGANFGGNKLSNVADGTEASDAATYGQLTKAVDEAKKAASEDAADQIKKATRAFTADDNGSINATLATAVGVKGADSNITTSIEDNDIKVKLSSNLSGLNSVETNSITAGKGNFTTLNAETGTINNLSSETGNIKTLNTETGNITTLNSETGNIKTLNTETGNITTLNSETGNIKNLNSDKVTAKVIEVATGEDSKLSISKDGINAGGKGISNLADGVDAHDAATVGQLSKEIEKAKADASQAADDKIKALKGESTRKFSTDKGSVDATLEDTVAVAGGDNITTSGDGKMITVSLKDKLMGLESIETKAVTGLETADGSDKTAAANVDYVDKKLSDKTNYYGAENTAFNKENPQDGANHDVIARQGNDMLSIVGGTTKSEGEQGEEVREHKNIDTTANSNTGTISIALANKLDGLEMVKSKTIDVENIIISNKAFDPTNGFRSGAEDTIDYNDGSVDGLDESRGEVDDSGRFRSDRYRNSGVVRITPNGIFGGNTFIGVHGDDATSGKKLVARLGGSVSFHGGLREEEVYNPATGENELITIGDQITRGNIGIETQPDNESMYIGLAKDITGVETMELENSDSVALKGGDTELISENSKRVVNGRDVYQALQNSRSFSGDRLAADTEFDGAKAAPVIKPEPKEAMVFAGGAKGALTAANIGTVVETKQADGRNAISVRLAADLKDMNSIDFGPADAAADDGNRNATLINKKGVLAPVLEAINGPRIVGAGVDEQGRKLSGGIDMNGGRITNLSPGIAPNDAATVAQVKEAQGMAAKSGALGAALAGLKPISYDPTEPTHLMGAFGRYKDQSAVALGLAHYRNESQLFHGGISYSGSTEFMWNLGFTYRFGTSGDKNLLKYKWNSAYGQVQYLQSVVQNLKDNEVQLRQALAVQNKGNNELITKQTAELAAQKQTIVEQQAQLDAQAKQIASQGEEIAAQREEIAKQNEQNRVLNEKINQIMTMLAQNNK